MREVVTRPRAYADLEGIWLYTYDQWGEEQAARYLRRLNERIMELAEEPERGKSMEAVRAGYYSIHVGRHLVFSLRLREQASAARNPPRRTSDPHGRDPDYLEGKHSARLPAYTHHIPRWLSQLSTGGSNLLSAIAQCRRRS